MIAAKEHNLETALKLAASGLSVFPCFAGGEQTKRPMPFIKWRDVSTTDVMQIRQWWAKWPGAAIGLDLAKCGFVVIDCDRHDADADGVDAFGQLAAAHSHDIDASPLVATPKEGSHVYFRQPDGKSYGNARGTLPAGVDVRGAGGYVIAPGTVMEDGRAYELFGNLSAAPVLPQWVADIIDTGEEQPKAQPVPVPREAHSDARVNAYCEAAISAEISKVENAAKGGRNNTLNEAAFALGQLVGAGWKSEAEIAGLLMNAAAACGLNPVESRKTIQSGIRAGAKEPRQLPPSEGPELEAPEELARINAMILAAWEKQQREKEGVRQIVEQQDGTIADAETGEIIETPSLPVQAEGGIDYPSGLVGDIARWIVETSRRPQPELAIGAALAIVGTVAGRQFAGPTRSGTHLYVLGLAPTGKGKDHPLQQISRIMSAASLGHHIGPSEFISMPAVVNFLTRKPLSICPMDEFGGFMKRINSRRASGFESSISKVLRTMWSSSFAPYLTPEWASKPSETIHSPSITIFGASTPEQFYSAMEGASLEDGTLNRFLLMSGRSSVSERDPLQDAAVVPTDIIDRLRRIYFRSGELASAIRNDPNADPSTSNQLRLLPWCPDGAQIRYGEFSREIERLMDKDVEASAFYARTVEMSLRIATIVAIGRLDDEQVRRADMEFGIEVAHQSARFMASGAADYMADNENQANAQRIMRAIKGRKGRASQRDLMRSLQNSIRPRDLRELLQALCEAGQLERQEVKPPQGGHPVIWFQIGK
ncbi:bifunctional DNA primase/polymerase [Ochrobactrum intermedium]|uniref:bifunctional DNA primase/polymerase n=1 Tax=Brucella intermedia TaxID=94625 RepID=UPI00159C3A6C|nr:bifunctional DNA primase/polymerase [Brucella intermedia]NVM43200.1 bifunctional DNA primase/polymerase [Brucella intermedia]